VQGEDTNFSLLCVKKAVLGICDHFRDK